MEWNVIVTVCDGGFLEARHLLRESGEVVPTEYHNVIAMRVADVRTFLKALRDRCEEAASGMRVGAGG